MREYQVDCRVRGTQGERRTITIRFEVIADDHGEAVERVKGWLAERFTYTVRQKWGSAP